RHLLEGELHGVAQDLAVVRAELLGRRRLQRVQRAGGSVCAHSMLDGSSVNSLPISPSRSSTVHRCPRSMDGPPVHGRICVNCPPNTRNTWPVMCAAASVARNVTRGATFSGAKT